MKLTKEQMQEVLDLSEHHCLYYNEAGQYMPWIKDGNVEGDGFNEEILAFAQGIRESVLAEIEADGWQLAPKDPTVEMWDGLARKIILAWDFNSKTPRELVEFLGMSGFELSDDALGEGEMANKDHVISKGTRAVILYKAMLAAAPKYKEIEHD